MEIGSGTKVHVRAGELPSEGRFVLSLSRHLAAWVDGKLFDTYDCSRGGTRCVYGYYIAPVSMNAAPKPENLCNGSGFSKPDVFCPGCASCFADSETT